LVVHFFVPKKKLYLRSTAKLVVWGLVVWIPIGTPYETKVLLDGTPRIPNPNHQFTIN